MNQLNVVIAQLQLVVAILAAEGEDTKNPDVATLLSKAKLELTTISAQFGGQDLGGPMDTAKVHL
jgi:hypothetical protein